MMLIMNFGQRYATYLAYCLQFGSVISNVFLLFFQRHPKLKRPVIDYNTGLVLCPIVMLGSTAG